MTTTPSPSDDEPSIKDFYPVFIVAAPKKQVNIKSKYPSTMSDSLLEHLLTLMGIIR